MSPPHFARKPHRQPSVAADSVPIDPIPGAAERIRLEDGLQEIRSLLESRGFAYSAGSEAASSAGPFATGTFQRGPLRIGFIVRNRDALGCPNYTDGQGYVGHTDLAWALGAEGKERLVEGEWLSYRARDGGDPFAALQADLKELVLPVLDASERTFLESLARARQHLREKRGW